MSDVIGRGIIELSADSSKVNAAINDARRSIAGLGEASAKSTKSASDSIDRYVTRLQTQAKTQGMSTRETELYKLALRGANDEQLRAANSALKLTEAHAASVATMDRVKAGLIGAATLSVAVVAGFGAMIANSINAADHLNDLNKITGISVEELSGLALLAKQSGSDLDGLSDAISKLSKNIGENPEKFAALGVSAKDPLKAFQQLADIFVAIEDPQKRSALGAEALGKSWKSAAPALSEGGQAIGEIVAKGARLSGITKEMAESADKLNDKLEQLKATSAGFGSKLAEEMLPAFIKITDAVTAAYEESGKLAAAWTAMGALGTFLFTSDFEGPRAQIKSLEEQLAGMQKRLAILRAESPTRIGLQIDIDEQIKAIDTIKEKLAALRVPAPKPDTKKSPPPELVKRVDDFIRKPKTGADTAGQEAKAQLAADLDQIKKGSEALLGAYANADKIMQARRAADLIDEKDYYAAKKGFLILNSAEQERALQAEITRLQAEKLVGKDKIDNARKIADAQAQLAKVRADTVASAEVLAIQEEAANRKIAQSYAEATIAAQAYLDTVAHQNARAVAGQGQGAKAREEQAGRNQIEDKFTGQRQGLERDLRRGQITKEEFDVYLSIAKETYAKEVELFNQRTADILASQGDWQVGMSEALANYRDELADIAKRTETSMTGAFKSIEGAMSDFFFNPFDKGIKGMIASFATAIQRMVADAISADLMRHLVGSGSGSGASKGLLGSLIGAFSGGGYKDLAGVAAGVPQFAEGTPYVARTGLAMIHQGERIIPAEQNRSGAGGTTIIVNVGGGAAPDVRRAAGQGAREALAAFTMAQRYS